MHELLTRIQAAYPELKFSAGDQFCWSPETQEIFYRQAAKGNKALWSLLHETGHALLGHTTYHADFELLKLEAAAWEKARQLASKFSLTIDEDHIQDCLDTYRDWLYKRSICPNCNTKCLQESDFIHYRCFNCHKVWQVSQSRFSRAYRRSQNIEPTIFA